MAAVDVTATEKCDHNMPMVTDDEGEQFPAVSEEALRIRRKKLRMDDPRLLQFIDQCEFISLGACCAVSRGLQYLGLKKHSYPFDWLRSPVNGVIHLLDNDFVDFLTYTHSEVRGDVTVYTGTRWGGSFWHHDPGNGATLRDFTRRVRRLLGFENVDASQCRFFVRGVNSTLELKDTLRLRDALRRSFPSIRFYLLVIVDYQPRTVAGMYQLAGPDADDLLFCLIDDRKYGDGSFESQQRMLQIFAENYAVAVSEALHIFSDSEDACKPTALASINDIIGQCWQFDGGSCNNGLFAPTHFKGQRIRARDNYRCEDDPLIDLYKVREAAIVVPENLVAGDLMECAVFDCIYSCTIPDGAVPGKSMLVLTLKEGQMFMSMPDEL